MWDGEGCGTHPGEAGCGAEQEIKKASRINIKVAGLESPRPRLRDPGREMPLSRDPASHHWFD